MYVPGDEPFLGLGCAVALESVHGRDIQGDRSTTARRLRLFLNQETWRRICDVLSFPLSFTR